MSDSEKPSLTRKTQTVFGKPQVKILTKGFLFLNFHNMTPLFLDCMLCIVLTLLAHLKMLINPRHACAARVTYSCRVCTVCVCPFKSHFTSGGLLFVVKTLPRTQRATRSKQLWRFLKMFHTLQRSSAPSLDGHTSVRPFFLQGTRMCNVDTRVIVHDVKLPTRLHAVSSPCVLALQRSLRCWRGLARVVCLPGYPLPRNISWTVVPLYSCLSRYRRNGKHVPMKFYAG